MEASPGELRWHEDGHSLWLQLARSELVVATVVCPNANTDEGECHSRQAPCVVTHFIDRFGLECNVGICPPTERLDIAWALTGDADDLDSAQVWVIPTADDVYASWRLSQDASGPLSNPGDQLGDA